MANAVIPPLAPLQLEVFDKEDNIVKVYLVVKGKYIISTTSSKRIRQHTGALAVSNQESQDYVRR